MSNLIKSGFVAFSQDKTLVIDANQHKIIKAIDSMEEEMMRHESIEEALAEALIRDAELEDEFNDDSLLTLSPTNFPEFEESEEDLRKVADEIIQSAKMEAEDIISKAHDEAEQLRAAAFEEAKVIREQAKDDGYRDGYEESMDVVKDEIARKEALLEQQVEDCQNQLRKREIQLTMEVENRMVELLCQLIPSITGVVIEGQKDVLLYMINVAMHDLDDSKHFVIKVSCGDYEDLIERKDEIYGALNPAISLEIFEDSKLSALQCLIETDNGIVDVSLDVQLENLNKALKLMIKE